MARTPRTATATNTGAAVTSHRHQDKRANIPTEELRDFVAEDEAAPTTLLYPRDPQLHSTNFAVAIGSLRRFGS